MRRSDYCLELQNMLPIEARRASCYSKKRYSSEDMATTVAKKCRRERGAILRVYHCSECAGFHLTSKGASDG